MKPLRLLVLSSDTYPPTRVDVSVLFAAELAKRGHEIDWILQSEAACRRAYVAQWGGGRVWVGATDLGTSLFARIRKHVLGIANDCRMFGRLRRTRYDAVQVKDKFLSGLLAMMARRCFHTRFIYWLSYPFPEHYLLRAQDGTARYPRLYRWRGLAFKWMLYRWLLPAADHVFVQSDQMRLDVAAEGIALEKMTAVPMGIDVDMVRAAGSSGKRRLLPAGVPCVLYLGTLDKVRRLDFLIRVFAAVRASVPGAKLFIVGGGGDPEEQHFLEREALRLDLSSAVEFLGRLPQARALDYVQEADVCVSPFFPTPVLRSASPTKLIEYMAMGRPVVANDQPEQRRIIEASGAGHCVAYQEEPFAAAIVELLNDPETANRMGAAGRRYVFEHRAYPVIADIVEKRLLSVAASGT